LNFSLQDSSSGNCSIKLIRFMSKMFLLRYIFLFIFTETHIILLNGFAKKTTKTPRKEIAKAESLMKEYYNEKRRKV